MVRYQAFNARGDEYYILIPLAPAGEQRRRAEERALDSLEAALGGDHQPGEVALKDGAGPLKASG